MKKLVTILLLLICMPVLPAMTADTTESGYQYCDCPDCGTAETCGDINSKSSWTLECYDDYTATLYSLNEDKETKTYHCEPCHDDLYEINDDSIAQVQKNKDGIHVSNTDKCYRPAYFYYDDEQVYNSEAPTGHPERHVTTELPYLNPATKTIKNKGFIQTWMNNKGYSNRYFNGIYYLDESDNKIFLYDQDYNPTAAIITDPNLNKLHLDLLDIQWDITVCKSTNVKDCSTPQTMYATDPTITYDVPLGYNCTILTRPTGDTDTTYFKVTSYPKFFEAECVPPSGSSTCWYIKKDKPSPISLTVYAQLTLNKYTLQFKCPDPSNNSTITDIQINTTIPNTTISEPKLCDDKRNKQGWKVDTTNTEILCTDGTKDCLTKTYYFSSSTPETLEMVPKTGDTITFIPNFEFAVFKDDHGTFTLD